MDPMNKTALPDVLTAEAENLPATVEIKLPDVLTAEAFFNKPDAVEDAIAKVEATVRGHIHDLTTRKGRDEIASLAYRVSKSKTYLDGEGKKLVDGIKAQAAGIDAARKLIRDRLDALRDEARKPLTEWEAAEEARAARDKALIASLSNHGMTGHEPAADIVAKAGEIRGIALPEDFGGDRDQADATRTATMQALRNMWSAAQAREAEAAELAKLRAEAEERRVKEAEERAERERVEREAEQDRQRAEAAEKARKDAEERADAEIARTKREAEEAIERAQREAAERIESERKAAADREAQAEQARQEEADRLRKEAEEKAAREAEEKASREADEARRKVVRTDIVAALSAMSGRATPEAIADALIAGQIHHCFVRF